MRYLSIITFALVLLALTSCKKHQVPVLEGSAVYYWKTVYKHSDWDRAFLKEHDVKRLYLRLFDVDVNENYGKPVPIATTQFSDRVPQGIEIVPVVYITNECLPEINQLDEKLYKRIKAMSKKHGFADFRELQLDCDWSESTRSAYFAFCDKIVQRAHQDGRQVSVTLRLHQLTDTVPPVDAGVLMLYNTGSFYDPTTENSILSVKDVKPYLKKCRDYDLPLSLAYPTYNWGILLREGEFICILHQTEFSDIALYEKKDESHYVVKKSHELEGQHLWEGDVVRLETSDVNTIRQVKTLVEDKLGKPRQSVIYHLDSLNLQHYSINDLNDILR